MISMLRNILCEGSSTEERIKGEGILDQAQTQLVRLDEKKCEGCTVKRCVKACPCGALTQSGAKINVSSIKCIECRACSDICPAGAVTFADFGIGSAEFNSLSKNLENEIKNVFSNSFHIRQLDVGSCNGCDHEMVSITNPVFDVSRFGIDFVASPRHADCLLVTGPVSWNLRESLIRTYNATPDPKIVIALGTCAASGEPFGESYASYAGVDKFIPVDVYIPGCPPHPYAIIEGLLRAVRGIGAKKR